MALKISFDIANGMHHLHTHSNLPIIHRDLKSPNVLMASYNFDDPVVCKVTDFGLAGVKLTIATERVANPRWLAPEIMRGDEFTPEADVFSFAVIMWETLARKMPWIDQGFNSVVEDFIKNGQRLIIPPNTNPDFENLINKCWSQDPKARPNFGNLTRELVLVAAKNSITISSMRGIKRGNIEKK